jgi:hypothetical protein
MLSKIVESGCWQKARVALDRALKAPGATMILLVEALCIFQKPEEASRLGRQRHQSGPQRAFFFLSKKQCYGPDITVGGHISWSFWSHLLAFTPAKRRLELGTCCLTPTVMLLIDLHALYITFPSFLCV